MALGLIQLLTEMSTRNISRGVKAVIAWDWQSYYLHVPIVLKSGSLNLLEPSGPVKACNGMALRFYSMNNSRMLQLSMYRWIHTTLTWRGTTSRQMPSVKWDHCSYRRSARTVLTWRGNASRFDQVWSRFDQYVELLSCHHHYLFNNGREIAAW
jgi:hypothetical protein